MQMKKTDPIVLFVQVADEGLWQGEWKHGVAGEVTSPCGIPSPHASPCPGHCWNATLLHGCLPNFFTTHKHYSNAGDWNSINF